MANRKPHPNASSISFGGDSDAPVQHSGKRQGPREQGEAPFAMGSGFDSQDQYQSVARADFAAKDGQNPRPQVGKASGGVNYNIITGAGGNEGGDRGHAGKRPVNQPQPNNFNILTGQPK